MSVEERRLGRRYIYSCDNGQCVIKREEKVSYKFEKVRNISERSRVAITRVKPE